MESTIEFCPECDNMLYMKIKNEDDTNKLINYCKNCGYHTDIKKINHCIYDNNFVAVDTILKENSINRYTTLDPTLPKAKGIKCPNANCPSATPDIVYVNYNENKMKYTYICLDCKAAGEKLYVW